MTHDVVYYFGLSFFILGIIGLFLTIGFMNKKKKTLDLQGLFKKYGVFCIIATVLFLIGFILLNVAFYIDEATINLLKENNLTVKPIHQFYTYFFGIIFVISLFSAIYNFFFCYYLPLEDLKIRKIFKAAWIISTVVFAVSFIVFSEGNAPYLSYPLANTIHIGKEGIILVRNTGNLGGLNIALYAIFILSGAILVLFICDHFCYKFYHYHGLLYTCFLIAFPAGIIGARLRYVVLDISASGASSQYVQDWTKIFDFKAGGLGIMGGAILGIIAGVSTMLVLKYGLKRKEYRNINYLHLVDFIVPTILIAQAIGRWGNFFNNEVNGYPVPVSYFSFLPTFIKNNMHFAEHGSTSLPADQIYLPLFFIESVTNLIGYFVLYYGFGTGFFSKYFIKFINLFSKEKNNPIIKADKYHADGTLAGGYLIWYGFTRVILEPLRTSADYYGFSITSAYLMVGGGALIVIFFILYKHLYTDRKKKKIEATSQDA